MLNGRKVLVLNFMLFEITLTMDFTDGFGSIVYFMYIFLSPAWISDSRSNKIGTFFNIGTKMNWIRHMADICTRFEHTHTHTPSFTVEIQVSVFHFRHKITVANILFGHTFSYFLLRFVWFLLWFLLYLIRWSVLFYLIAITTAATTKGIHFWRFNVEKWERTFSHVPFETLTFFSFSDIFFALGWL